MTNSAKLLIVGLLVVGALLATKLIPAAQPQLPVADTSIAVAERETVAARPLQEQTVDASKVKFYFDVAGHSPEEFRALLHRAHMIYEQTPSDQRSQLEVVMVLHGPDIAYFAGEKYDQYQDIVDLAAKLDAFGVFDFKVCQVAAGKLGLDAEQLPAFIEFVAFGPGEVDRLEQLGFVRL